MAIIGKVYKKADEAEIADCYLQFFKDLIKEKQLFSLKCQETVKHTIKGLSHPFSQRKEISGADSLFEQIIADVLMNKYRTACTAEELGFSNAMGYDICIPDENMYIEAKAYSVTYRSGRLSANIGNLQNKFCSVVCLVIDPFLDDTKKYRIYVIPPEEITTDTSDYIDIPHHRVFEAVDLQDNKCFICEQLLALGGNKNIYLIDSLSDILELSERFKTINIKRLASALRLQEPLSISVSQDAALQHLKVLWNHLIKTSNSKRKDKFPLDYHNEVYDIQSENNPRLFFKNNRIQ